jgi:D-lactate dehydrogenase
MRVAFYDYRRYDRQVFEEINLNYRHDITFIEARLTEITADLASGCEAVCAFVNDCLNEVVLTRLKEGGVRIVALRSAGYNHVDLEAARRLGLHVVRVPEYSPHAVAEHAMALLLTLNRKIHRANARVRELNFSLEGLVGFDLHRKTAGVIGTGRIGQAFCRILTGFGCRILASDPVPSPEMEKLGVSYVSLEELCAQSDFISLHAPLLPATRHMIDETKLNLMKPGVLLINTSRGALIDTRALIKGLKTSRIGAAGLDVYEEEENVFFRDLSDQVLQDDVLARLLTFPNVIITAHQGFLTHEALSNIADTTLSNIRELEELESGKRDKLTNAV